MQSVLDKKRAEQPTNSYVYTDKVRIYERKRGTEMKTYTHIIFDLDDTLLDFQQTQAAALRHVLEEYQLPKTTETTTLYQTINTNLWKEMEKGNITRADIFSTRFEAFLNEFGLDVNGAAVDEQYRRHLETGFQTIAQAPEVLSSLKAKGFHLLAGSNGVGRIQRKRLAGSKLRGYFEDLFISEEVGFSKPDKRFFETIFDKTKESDPSKYIMVGDSLTADIQGAKNVGIDSVWFQPHAHDTVGNSRDSTYTIETLPQLLSVVESPNLSESFYK